MEEVSLPRVVGAHVRFQSFHAPIELFPEIVAFSDRPNGYEVET